MGVDKEELSSRCTKTFKGHFLKSWVIFSNVSLSTFKAKLLSHCSSTVVYDIPISSSTFIASSLLVAFSKPTGWECQRSFPLTFISNGFWEGGEERGREGSRKCNWDSSLVSPILHLPLKAHWGRGVKVPPLRLQCTLKERQAVEETRTEEARIWQLVFRHRLSHTHIHTHTQCLKSLLIIMTSLFVIIIVSDFVDRTHCNYINY